LPAGRRERGSPLQYKQRLWAVGGLAGIAAKPRERDAGQLKLIGRGSINPLLAAGQHRPVEDLGRAPFEGEDLQQFGHVDVFGR
jgi:hypothetical protein